MFKTRNYRLKQVYQDKNYFWCVIKNFWLEYPSWQLTTTNQLGTSAKEEKIIEFCWYCWYNLKTENLLTTRSEGVIIRRFLKYCKAFQIHLTKLVIDSSKRTEEEGQAFMYTYLLWMFILVLQQAVMLVYHV